MFELFEGVRPQAVRVKKMTAESTSEAECQHCSFRDFIFIRTFPNISFYYDSLTGYPQLVSFLS